MLDLNVVLYVQKDLRAPTKLSITPRENGYRIATTEIIPSAWDYHGIEDEDQAGFVWNIDLPQFFETRTDAPNRAGGFALDGYDPSNIQPGFGYTGEKFSHNLHQNIYHYGNIGGRNPGMYFWNGPQYTEGGLTVGRIGWLFIRRQNNFETVPNFLIMPVCEPLDLQTNYPYTIITNSLEIGQYINSRPMEVPFRIVEEQFPPVIGDLVPVTFTIEKFVDPWPDYMNTFFLKSSKGKVPTRIQIVDGVGTFDLDTTGVPMGTEIQVRVGLDWLRKSQTLKIMKGA